MLPKVHQDHSNGTTWGHVISADLARWTRVRPIFSPRDPYQVWPARSQYQCDGSLSFPEGIGPVVMWTPDWCVSRPQSTEAEAEPDPSE